MRSRALKLAGTGLVCVLTVCSPAFAEPLPSVDLRLFQPPTDPKGSLYMEPVMTPGAGLWNTSGFVSYAYRPLVLRNANGDVTAQLVRHQLSFDYLANIGIGQRAALGLALPTVLGQWGDTSPATARILGESSRPSQAIGDLALTGKATLLPQPEMGGFGLSALARISLPTGDRTSFIGEGSVTSEVRLLAEMRLIAVAFQATTGFKVRTERRQFAGETWGDEIPWGVAIALKPQAFGWDSKGRWTWVAESHGSLPAGPSAPLTNARLSPALVGASARYQVKDVSLLGGVEGPLDNAAGVPSVRAVGSLQWAPRSHDADHDGVEDSVDECPDLAEDRDGFEDKDGCPDFDNDDDGAPDTSDRCPGAKEDEDGFEDDDGCPDPDNDRDGIPDVHDACPDAAGAPSSDPKLNGCPNGDRDNDGIMDRQDACPEEPEDRDEYQDQDGCPDLDNDQDKILDSVDKCTNSPEDLDGFEDQDGCPDLDNDGDTFADTQDQCPKDPETWNGVKDDDGCPETQAAPLLVTLQQTATGPSLKLRENLRFTGSADAPEIDAKSIPTLRAVGAELNSHPNWIVAVGARPTGGDAFQSSARAMARSFAIVLALRKYTLRDGVAETVGWVAVKDQPGADRSGVGFLVLGSPASDTSSAGPAQGETPP